MHRFLQCLIVEIYLNNSHTKEIASNSDTKKSNNIYYDKCKSLAYTRIQEENLYVRTVMISSSNQILKSSFDAYTINYFVKEKLSSLKQKLIEFVSVFYTIYKQAPVSKSCSK